MQLAPFYSTETKISIDVQIIKTEALWNLFFELKGDLSSIDFLENKNTSTQKNPTSGLWKKTCFEFFIFEKESDFYHEWNFNTEYNWDYQMFNGYRNALSISTEANNPTKVSYSKMSPERFIFRAQFKQDSENPLILPSCVINTHDNKTEYWALKHSCEKPDFHTKELAVEFI